MTAPDVIFVDTETSGLHPDLHEIWEVAACWTTAEHGRKDRHWFLPINLGRADPFALSIGRFHERYPHGESSLTPLRTFARQFAEITRGKHMAGAVISFDDQRLAKLLRANGALPEWNYHVIDVEALAVGWLMGYVDGIVASAGSALAATVHLPRSITLPWKSDVLSKAVGVDPDQFEKHTALGDSRWAEAIYRKCMGLPSSDEVHAAFVAETNERRDKYNKNHPNDAATFPDGCGTLVARVEP